MYGGLIGTHQRSFEWYHPEPLWPPLSRHWGLQLSYPLLSQEQVKLQSTDFKFGGYIYRANLNKSTLKILEKMECGRIQRLPNFLGYPPLLSRERAKLQTSYLAGTFTGTIQIKAYYKFRRKVSMGVSGECPNFLGTPYYLRNG